MRIPKNISLKVKMLGGLSLILGTSLTVVLHIVEGSKNVQDQIRSIIDTSFPSMELSTNIISIVEKTKGVFFNIVEELEVPDEEVLEEYIITFEELKENFERHSLLLAKVEIDTLWHYHKKNLEADKKAKEKDSLSQLLQKNSALDTTRALRSLILQDTLLTNIRQTYAAHHENIIHLIKSAVKYGGLANLPDSLLEAKEASVLMELISEFRNQKKREFSKSLNSIYNQAENFSTFALSSGIFLLLIIIFILLMSENIFKNLARLVASAKKISLGQADVSIDLSRRDELGQINSAFERLRRQQKKYSAQQKTGIT